MDAPPAELSLAFTHHITNNFSSLSTWNYPTLYDVYCVGGSHIHAERNVPMGVFFLAEYLFYLALYLPSLVVMSRRSLLQHSCYKLMLAVGVQENVLGFFATFMAGVLSIAGTGYCENTMLLTVNGHLAHGEQCPGPSYASIHTV